MSIRFAFARKNSTSPVVRALTRGPLAEPVNDNQADLLPGAEHAMTLNAALRHFARHGLGAAAEARNQAEAAFFAGDREGYRWWLGICRTLDRRIARQLARGTGQD